MSPPQSKQRAQDDAPILVVDDDPLFRQLAAATLDHLGYPVLDAVDGSAGWALLNAYRIRLAVVDLEMPNLDGFGLIESIRLRPGLQHLPVVVITSRDDPAAIQKVFEAGATSYLIKPVSWPTFGSHIQCLLRVSEGQRRVRAKHPRVDGNSDAVTVLTQLLLRSHHFITTCEARSAGTSRSTAPIEALAEFKLHVRTATHALERLCGYPVEMPSAASASRNLAPLRSMLAAMQTRVAELSRERSVPVGMATMDADVFIECDPDAFVGALAGLVANAIAVSAPGQNVLVNTTLAADGELTVTVSDDGPGLKPDVLTACRALLDCGVSSNRFVSTQAEGMEHVRSVLMSLQGHVAVQSKPRRGTVVTLAIPAARVQDSSRWTDTTLPAGSPSGPH